MGGFGSPNGVTNEGRVSVAGGGGLLSCMAVDVCLALVWVMLELTFQQMRSKLQ